MAEISQKGPTVQLHSESCNLAFAGASNYKGGLVSFKHSSVDGQSASLTDLCNGEQVNKYRISEPFTVTALLSHVMWGFCLHLTT